MTSRNPMTIYFPSKGWKPVRYQLHLLRSGIILYQITVAEFGYSWEPGISIPEPFAMRRYGHISGYEYEAVCWWPNGYPGPVLPGAPPGPFTTGIRITYTRKNGNLITWEDHP